MLLWEMGLSGTRTPLECINELSKSQCWSKGFGLAVRTPLLLLLRSLHAQRVLTTSGQQAAVVYMQLTMALTWSRQQQRTLSKPYIL